MMDQIVITAPAHTMNAVPHWIALDKGFFREEGLEVEVEYIFGDRVRDAWVGDSFAQLRGKLVFEAPGGSAPFKAAKEGRQEINIISTQDRAPHIMISRPEIRSVADLKGKRIMAGVHGASFIDARVVLRHFGLDPDKDVEWVASEVKPPDTERSRVETLARGEVDAICSGPPHWHQAERMGFRRLTSARDIKVQPDDGLATTPEVIEKHPDVVKRVVRAMIRGTEFARLNREETLDIVLRNTSYVDRDTASACYDRTRDHWYVIADEKPYLDKIDLYCHEYGITPKAFDHYFNLRFVREALAELRLYRSQV